MKKIYSIHRVALLAIIFFSFDIQAAVREVSNPAELLPNNKPLVIEFYSPQCPHCMAMAPKYEKVAQRFANTVDCIRVNILKDNQCVQQAAQYYKVRIGGVPTFIFVDSQGTMSSVVGSKSEKELEKLIGNLR